MARSETVRRVKSYSAESGYVYQYYFYEVLKTRRGSSDGVEYVYMVSTDRRKVFPLRIFVNQAAVKRWVEKTNRPLSGTEEYALAKMRLFQALDEEDQIQTSLPDLIVDDSNLEDLLSQLNL